MRAFAVFATSGAAILTPVAARATVPLLVLAGQSNMVGYGSSYSDLTSAQQVTQPNVDYYYNNFGIPPYWSQLTPPTQLAGVANWNGGSEEIGFGPEISLGQNLVNAGVYSTVAMEKSGVNGSFLATQAEIPASAGINGNWNPATVAQSGVYISYFQQMLGEAAAAQQSYGQPTQISAFIWMQGESDAEYQSTADAYESNLISLIAAVRTSFNNPNLPFIYGRIDDQDPGDFPYASTVRAADDAVAQMIPNVYEVNTDDLPLRGDFIHYTSDGLIELGNRFASGLETVLSTTPWNGGGADNNWTTAGNWGGTAPVNNLILNFGGNTRTTNNNNFAAGTQFNGMQFLSGAGAFTINGNSVNLAGNVVSNSTALQTINTPLVLTQTVTFDAAAGDIAVGGAISGASGLLFSGPGNVTLSAVNGYTGDTNVVAGTLTIASTGSVATTGNVIVAAGSTLNVNGLLTGNPTLTVNGGAVHFGPNTTASTVAINLTAINLNTNATITVAAALPHRTVLVTSDLNFTDNTGLLDLNSDDMIVHNGSLSAIDSEIASAHGAGNVWWTGTTGITSSSAAAAPGESALGVELNSDGQGGVLMSSFDGQTVTDTDVLVKYTFAGDADLSGSITASDYQLIDNGFNMHLAGWRNGDFNYDGVVNGDDYALIDNAFNTQETVGISSVPAVSPFPAEMIASDTSEVASAVPEPTGVGILAIAGLLYRRRR